ncbi:MAG: GspMb/PilO family protein [Phycisphaerales bacterium]
MNPSIKLGAGMLVLGAVVVWIGVLPAVKRAEKHEQRILTAKHTIMRTESRAEDIRALADTLTAAREYAAKHTKAISDQDASLLMHDIGRLLTELNVTSHQMTQDRPVERDGARVTPVTLTMQADYPTLVSLLDTIGRGDNLVRVVKLNVNLPRGAQAGAQALEIEAQFEAIAAIRKPGGVMASAEEGAAP